MARLSSGAKLARVLTSIVSGSRTGTLEVTSADVTTILFFSQGSLVFAEQGTLGETLGRRLLREGKLTQEQYAAVIQQMTAALIESEQMRFGEVVVALGYLEPEEVSEALRAQVRRKLLCCFQWARIGVGWDPSPEPVRSVAHWPTPVLPVIVEGIREFWTLPQTLPTLGPNGERYLVLAKNAHDVSRQLELTPGESGFLRKIDGRTTVNQLRDGRGLDRLGRARLLCGLILTGGVRLANRALDPSKPPPPASSPEPSRVAVQRLAAQLAASRKRLERKSLVPPEDEHRAALEAEQAHQRGRTQMGYDAWPVAARELRRAADLQPEVIEYELYARWAEFRANPPSAGDARRARKKLMELTQRVRKKDRDNAFAWHVRGQLAALEGDDEGALKFFSRAYALDRGDSEAERFLRLLKRRLAKK